MSLNKEEIKKRTFIYFFIFGLILFLITVFNNTLFTEHGPRQGEVVSTFLTPIAFFLLKTNLPVVVIFLILLLSSFIIASALCLVLFMIFKVKIGEFFKLIFIDFKSLSLIKKIKIIIFVLCGSYLAWLMFNLFLYDSSPKYLNSMSNGFITSLENMGVLR